MKDSCTYTIHRQAGRLHALYPTTRFFLQFLLALILLSFCFPDRAPISAQPLRVMQQEWLSSLSNLAKADTQYIKKLYRQASETTLPDSSLRLSQEGLALSRQLHYTYGEGLHLLGIARAEGWLGNPYRAISWLRLARPACEQSGRPGLWGNYYLYGSRLYNEIGYKDTAIEFAHKLLDITNQYPEWDNTEMAAGTAYGQLGRIYMEGRQDPMLAISYFEKALHIAERNGSREQYPQLYANLGGAWANSNQEDSSNTAGYRKGLGFYFKAETCAQQLGDQGVAQLANVYQNVSGIYNNLDMPDSAEFYLKKLFALPEQYISQQSRIAAQYILAAGFHRKKDYPKAIRYYNEAGQLARLYHINSRLLDIEQNLFSIYKETRQHQKALEHLEAYSSLRDSLLDKEKIKAVQQLEVKFRTAEKDKELALKNLSLTTQQSQLREKNIWIDAGALSSLVLAGWLLVWRRNSRRRQRAQLRLVAKELQLWKQDEEIRNLKAMVNGEEKERARIGRELHDGIVGQLSAAKLNFNMIRKKYPLPEMQPDFNEALAYLEETAQDLRKTAHNLMPGILIEQGLVTAVDAFCEKTAIFTGIRIDVCQDGILPRLDIDFELSAYRMVQELVQNIIKHAHATRVLVQLDYHRPILILTVEDNGIGITEMQAASGMGLNNLKTRVAALQGSIQLSSKPGEGTSVYIEFDVSLIKSEHAV